MKALYIVAAVVLGMNIAFAIAADNWTAMMAWITAAIWCFVSYMNRPEYFRKT